VRIIAGQYRSRQLLSPRGLKIRPTSDRLRETLFDVLTAGDPQRLEGSVWLDLYAGTGAVGIEALSRRARIVYFVEESAKAAELIRRNLSKLAVDSDSFEIMERETLAALRRLDAQAVDCDFCFVDPPYRLQGAYQEVLGFLSQSQMLKPSATVISEHDRKFDPAQQVGALQRYRKLEQGDSALSFYRRE
jgi:16S rRNA (guanine(966)-N(2))-methyltransferase RsmD